MGEDLSDQKIRLNGEHLGHGGAQYSIVDMGAVESIEGTDLATALGWCLVGLMTRQGEIGLEGFAN